eukprot:06786_5
MRWIRKMNTRYTRNWGWRTWKRQPICECGFLGQCARTRSSLTRLLHSTSNTQRVIQASNARLTSHTMRRLPKTPRMVLVQQERKAEIRSRQNRSQSKKIQFCGTKTSNLIARWTKVEKCFAPSNLGPSPLLLPLQSKPRKKTATKRRLRKWSTRRIQTKIKLSPNPHLLERYLAWCTERHILSARQYCVFVQALTL